MEYKTLDISTHELVEFLIAKKYAPEDPSVTIDDIQLENKSVKVKISSEVTIYDKTQQKFLNMKLDDMDISLSLHSYFKDMKIVIGADILKIPEKEWGALRNFGVKRMQELRTLVGGYDLELK